MSSLAVPHADSPSQPPVSFGAWLQRQRKAMRLSAEALAQTIYCSAVTLRKIEYEERLPSKDMAERLADVFSIPPDKRARFIEFARGNMLAYEHGFAEHVLSSPTPTPPELPLPPLPSPSLRTHNLPTPVTSFIGRAAEVDQIVNLLGESRLVTLTGSGGVGKTRLAIAVAHRLLELHTHLQTDHWLTTVYPDGVWLVELASLSDAGLVAGAVASALGLYEDNRQVLDALCHYLGRKQLVLLLDNCEHMVAACAKLVAHLLQACPKLKIISTSREVLGVMGETRFQVLPLAVAHHHDESQADLPDALRLFVARAKAMQPNFSLSNANRAVIGHICSQLDGSPLAIELAAVRLNVLSLDQIAARLDDRFKLLTGGNRTAIPQHQTLRATLEWSYGLLTSAERELFAQLAVFVGGWTLAAAEAIGGDEVLETLTRLVDKSLVTVMHPDADAQWLTEDGVLRYRYLETIRQFALEHLARRADTANLQRRHLAWLSQWCPYAAKRLVGPAQVLWYARINAEFDNIRAAVTWAMTLGDKEDRMNALWMLLSLDRFWNTHHHAEGQRWLEQALALRADLPPKLVGKMLERAALLAAFQAQNEQSACYADDAIATLRPLRDPFILAWALRHASACKLNALDIAGFLPLSQEALGLFVELGDAFGIAMVNTDMGTAAMLQRRYVEAQALLEASLDVIREHGDITRLLYMLGTAYAMSGDQANAEKYIKDSLRMGWQIEYRYAICHSFFWLARVALRFGEFERAAQLLGVHEMAQERYGLVILPVIEHYLSPTVQALRTQLGEATYVACFAQGQAMSLGAAVAWVLT